MRYLDGDAVAGLFGIELAIRSQHDALLALADPRAVSGKVMKAVGDDSLAFCYLARRGRSSPTVVKAGSVVPAKRGEPAVSSTIAVLDAVTGAVVAVLDAAPITTWRTAAASALVARRLASGACRRVAVIGAGVQALAHAVVAQAVLAADEIALWSRDPERLARAVASASARGAPVHAARSAAQATEGADVIFTCTSSRVPVLESEWVADGTVVVSIGSFEPGRCEVGPDLVHRAHSIVVDDVDSALVQAGPIVAAAAAGLITGGDLHAVGPIYAGEQDLPRTDGPGVVYYNSIGFGLQDACAAELIVQAALEQGLGAAL